MAIVLIAIDFWIGWIGTIILLLWCASTGIMMFTGRNDPEYLCKVTPFGKKKIAEFMNFMTLLILLVLKVISGW